MLERHDPRPEGRERHGAVTEVCAHIEHQIARTDPRSVETAQTALTARSPVHDQRAQEAEPAIHAVTLPLARAQVAGWPRAELTVPS